MKTPENAVKTDSGTQSEQWLETVRRQVASLRFGVVQITVHDARVVQIEKTEKFRFNRTEAD